MNRMQKIPWCASALGLLALSMLLPASAWSATVCYDESAYPAVLEILVEPTQVRIALGGRYSIQGTRSRSVLRYAPSSGWSRTRDVPCVQWGEHCLGDAPVCSASVPKIELSADELGILRPEYAELAVEPEAIDQSIGACAETDSHLWFGLRFYSGEGVVGVGGVGRIELETGQMELRRPDLLRELSIDRMLFDGRHLYVSTTHDYECLGALPSLGLLEYSWTEDRFERVPTCGRGIHDLKLVNGDLWVATDMGLSIGRPELDEAGIERRVWRHYEPDPTSSSVMRETACEEIHAHAASQWVRFDAAHDFLDSNAQLAAAGYSMPNWFRTELRNADRAGQDLSGQSWIGAFIEAADLRGARLVGADLRGARMAGARLMRADLSGAKLTGAQLEGANLQEANLTRAELRSIRASRASFAGANFDRANLEGADLWGADLSGAQLESMRVETLEEAQSLVDVTCGDAETRVPQGVEAPILCTDRDRSPTELEASLEAHALWLESKTTQGMRLDLRGPSLSHRVELTNAHLEAANLRHAQLRDARIVGSDLTDADLRHANLRGATLNQVQLEGVRLTGALLQEARLEGVTLRRTSLSDADLTSAQLSGLTLEDVRLRGLRAHAASLSRMDLEGLDLTFAELGEAELSLVKLDGARLVDANLSQSTGIGITARRTVLSGAVLTQAQWPDADLQNADLSNADLTRARLPGSHLAGARLSGTVLRRALLERVDLRRADLSYAVLSNADLRGADLTGARLEGANLRGARLKGVRFDGARLSGADLTGTSGLKKTQLDHACGDATTQLPSSIPTIAPCTPTE